MQKDDALTLCIPRDRRHGRRIRGRHHATHRLHGFHFHHSLSEARGSNNQGTKDSNNCASRSPRRLHDVTFRHVLWAASGSCVGSFKACCLNWRTGHRSVRAKNATMSRVRLEYRSTALTVVKEPASVRRHRFGFLVPTLGTGEQRSCLNFRHGPGPSIRHGGGRIARAGARPSDKPVNENGSEERNSRYFT